MQRNLYFCWRAAEVRLMCLTASPPKLSPEHQVYGITRRGYGASSAPVPTTVNDVADRLGDDILAAMDNA
jgi:hypothetical protein